MKPYLQDPDLTLYQGDALDVLKILPAESVHTCVTSPPFFGLRDYGTGSWEGGDEGCDHKPPARAPRSERPDPYGFGTRNVLEAQDEGATTYREFCGKCGARRVDQQIGLEATPQEWVERLVQVFEEVRRVLRPDGTLWVECGDSYCGGGGFAPDAPVNVKRREQIAAGVSHDGAFAITQRQHDRNIKGRVRP